MCIRDRVNGMSQTDTVNGTGNLIVGYNETDDLTAPITCSDGTHWKDQALCEPDAVWGANFRSGSHNLVLGSGNSYSSFAGLVSGHGNAITRDYAVVMGSVGSIAAGVYSVVSGGMGNTASGTVSSVSGGAANVASGWHSAVSGGSNNTASGQGSSVSGGSFNTASANYSSVSGGTNREAAGTTDWVAGTLFEDQ